MYFRFSDVKIFMTSTYRYIKHHLQKQHSNWTKLYGVGRLQFSENNKHATFYTNASINEAGSFERLLSCISVYKLAKHAFPTHAFVACRSETCAILRNVSDLYCVPFWNMCHSEAYFRLALWKLCHIENRQQFVFLIHLEIDLHLLLKKQTNKQTIAVAWPYFWSLYTILYASQNWIQHATSPKFAQCQSETFQKVEQLLD